MSWFKQKQKQKYVVYSNIWHRDIEYIPIGFLKINLKNLWKEYLIYFLRENYNILTNYHGLNNDKLEWTIFFNENLKDTTKIMDYYIQAYKSDNRPVESYENYIRRNKFKKILKK